MRTSSLHSGLLVPALFFLCTLATQAGAWEPTARELDAAIQTGDFASYLASATAWLDQHAPATATEKTLRDLVADPVFLATLDQRQLIARTGPDKLSAFAKADPANQVFLGWLLKNTAAMDLYLEAVVPLGLAAREESKYTLDTAALHIWRRILQADPDAKSGLGLKLAIATAIAPPGSINIGAGGAATPADPVARYRHYKEAQRNKELFPSFDHLSVWEYTHIVSSGASDADLTWARQMINTFRPDLRADERVVNSTSLVWRRTSPIAYDGSFRNVLAGGGKCGPRSSWSVMVCQAFGIPAIGVSQPGHACVAYKAAYPMTQPQPGSAWKVAYGAGWPASKLLGLSGADFLAGVEERAHAAEFSLVEHLRWLAAALPADRATAVMEVAHAIQRSVAAKPSPATSPAAGERDALEPTTAPAALQPATMIGGVLQVDAVSFAKTGGEISWAGQVPHVLVHDSVEGGRQVYFQQQMKSQWAEYLVEVPAAATYSMVMKAACINADQELEVCCGEVVTTVPIALSYGLWQETQPVELKLARGVQTLRIQTSTKELKRGIALKGFELKPKGS